MSSSSFTSYPYTSHTFHMRPPPAATFRAQADQYRASAESFREQDEYLRKQLQSLEGHLDTLLDDKEIIEQDISACLRSLNALRNDQLRERQQHEDTRAKERNLACVIVERDMRRYDANLGEVVAAIRDLESQAAAKREQR